MNLVPNKITDEVNLLLSKIDSPDEPQFIKCAAIPNAPQNECFQLVEEKVKSEGGERILGWQIWQGNLLVEAEFHAVWKSPIGNIIDITPKLTPLDKILFLPASSAVYKRKQINNIRINISKNYLVDELILVYDAVFRIENKGDRAFQPEFSLYGQEAEAYDELNIAKSRLKTMALQNKSKNSPCPCNSGKKYKVCHGKRIRKLITEF